MQTENKSQVNCVKLEKAANGGWVVYTAPKDNTMVNMKLEAAYTDHADMIQGLDLLLNPIPEVAQS